MSASEERQPVGRPGTYDGRPQMGRGPLFVVKRDGRVEPFDRFKMVNSMRNAGANSREADFIANMISARIAARERVPSSELSELVVQSLSNVNPTASRNYEEMRDRKLMYNQRVNMLSAELSAISRQANDAMVRIENLGVQIQGLQARLERVRKGNYRLRTHLESEQAALVEQWARTRPELQAAANLKSETIRASVQSLQKNFAYTMQGTDYDLSRLHGIEFQVQQLQSSLLEMQSYVNSVLSPIEEKFESINQDLRQAENTLALLENAAFPWEEDETPVVAVKAKDLNSNVEGVLTLTNLSFVYEQEKEVVLKKKLFVATEKKLVREVVVKKPIGMVESLVHGKVGLFKGSGLYVKFAPETGLPEMKFDTTREDAELIAKNYNYIISGQAEKELAATTAKEAAEAKIPQLVTCPVCGAPYREKIYRGQTSVNCKYCGTAISLKQ
ncbi:MAG: ATP cone domain-containing protein [Candidatus Bathyarchaeia archaeon]